MSPTKAVLGKASHIIPSEISPLALFDSSSEDVVISTTSQIHPNTRTNFQETYRSTSLSVHIFENSKRKLNLASSKADRPVKRTKRCAILKGSDMRGPISSRFFLSTTCAHAFILGLLTGSVPGVAAAQEVCGPPSRVETRSCLYSCAAFGSLIFFDTLGTKYLSLIMAAFTLSFPIVKADSHSPTPVVYITYLASLLATLAYGYVAFSVHTNPHIYLPLCILVSAQGGMQATLTFLPTVLSFSVFLVSKLAVIDAIIRLTFKFVYQMLADLARGGLHYMGMCLVKLGHNWQHQPRASERDVEEGRELVAIEE